MAEQLALLGEWHRAAPGTCVVFDTNVLLHYQPLDQIDWLTELDERAVRLVTHFVSYKSWTRRSTRRNGTR
jgi:hypothetical protein